MSRTLRSQPKLPKIAGDGNARLSAAIASAIVAALLGMQWLRLAPAVGVARAAEPTAVPAALPTIAPGPPPTTFRLAPGPWRLTADGTWAAVVKASYQDAGGADVPQVRGDVDFSATAGDVLGLVRRVYSDPAAQVTLRQSQSVTLNAKSNTPALGNATVTLPAPPDGIVSLAVVSQAVGPHLVNVGWTPLASAVGVLDYKLFRQSAADRHPRLIASLSPNAHTWRDGDVDPGVSYRYTIAATLHGLIAKAASVPVAPPAAMPPSDITAISGKGMFLYFAPTPDGDHGWARLDPDALIIQARSAGVRNIELRMAYGAFFESDNPAARSWVDRVIDGAAAAGINLLAWEVPRRGTTEDVAEAVSTARYRTQRGNGFGGLALDIENGSDYMGDGDAAKQDMVDYMQMARLAVGPQYLIVATVISPHMTHWTNKDYPYARIAPYASVMQPMEYWHYHFASSNHRYTEEEVKTACAQAVAQTRALSGRAVPVNVAGQSVDVGEVATPTATGVPSPQEITWSMEGSKRAGALGEMFFDWTGTSPEGWQAIGAFRW
ncbi:MAG: hypothetical protein M3T49_03465 [Candidatus Eremiobacteraeota bacterium]|nr:hypothetical protein [Candidatus Eremiobacteraeota bacterium]